MSAERSAVSPGGSSALLPERMLRVMLVDDEPATRKCVRILLSRQPGIEVVAEAANGLEAVEAADRLRPDILVMDVDMPAMDGLEATRRIKARHPGVRVIGFSMFDGAEASRKMLEAGAEIYLTKTRPAEELIAAVKGVAPDSAIAEGPAPALGATAQS